MSAQQPNAILAINSLDRYITSGAPEKTFFEADWAQDALNIVIKQSQPVGASRPRIGSVLSASNLSINPNSPVGGPIVTQIQYTTQNGYSILAGGIYTVLSLGDTNWAFIGAGSATPAIGTVFQATNNGIGNGSVKWVSVAYLSKPTIALQIAFVKVKQYTYSSTNSQQPFANYLRGQYDNFEPYSNNFIIQSPGALIYGYITKIIVSQIQLQYNIPTVNFDINDTFYITLFDTGIEYKIVIPYGFYYPDELAAVIQTTIAGIAGLSAAMIDVKFDPRIGFKFESLSTPKKAFYFPSLDEIEALPNSTTALVTNALKTYRLLGMTVGNSEFAEDVGNVTYQNSTEYPIFLYTPYIDFYSDVLTNYQSVKDTNTSVSKPKGLIARVYLSGGGSVQTTNPASETLGSRAFVVVLDLNSPKIIKWSPDVAVPSIDFQLRDCYGDLIPGGVSNNSTEFQMTLLCIEGNE